MQESVPKNKTESDEELEKMFYKYILSVFAEYDYEITMSEAPSLKQITRDVYIKEPKERGKYHEETGKTPLSSTTNKLLEVLSRFFLQNYRVNFFEYVNSIKEDEDSKKIIRNFFRYIEKLRKDRELI